MFPFFGNDTGHDVNESASPDAFSIAVVGASVIDPLLNDIQASLDAQGADIALKDYAVPGNTASRKAKRIESVASSNPDVILLSLGGNDIRYSGTFEESMQSLDRLKTSLEHIIDTARSSNIAIAAIGLNPDDLLHIEDRIREIHGDKADSIIERIDAIYDHVEQSVDYYHPSLHAGLSYPEHFSDRIHPNNAGQELLTQEFSDFIRDFSAKERATQASANVQHAVAFDEPQDIQPPLAGNASPPDAARER